MFFEGNFEEVRDQVFQDDNYTESEYRVSETGQHILYIDYYKNNDYHFMKCQIKNSTTKEVVIEFERTTPYCNFHFFVQNECDWLYSPINETFVDLENKKMYDSYNPNHVTSKWIHSQISPDGKTICVLENIMGSHHQMQPSSSTRGTFNLEFYDLTRFINNKPFKLELPANFYDFHRDLGIAHNSYEDQTDFIWNKDNTFTYKVQKEYCFAFGKYSDFLTNEEYNRLPITNPIHDEHYVMRDIVVRQMRKHGNNMITFNETMTPYYDTYNMQKNNI